jgi:DNA-binding XRE family transcriptional regulator
MNRLKTYRESQSKTPKQMARAMGISESSYYKVEGGQREPTYRFIKKFKEVFHVSVDEIFF